MPLRLTVFGDGAWGSAIALLLAENPQHRVTLWSARSENANLLRTHRENVRFLPGVPIPESIRLTNDPHEAADGADCWISAIPTVYLRSILSRLQPVWPGMVPVVSLSKGLEQRTFCRPSEILRDELGATRLAVLSGPSHAEEVARGQPTSVVVASPDDALCEWVRDRFTTERFRVYSNADMLGVELAGALKNVVGIAAGIGDGLGFGDNAKSALLTRALVELTRFGVALGAKESTFFGLAGLGDLITTCVSPHGRNRRVGERLGRGETLSAILADMPAVAEGVWTCRSVHERATSLGLELPIVAAVFSVLYENKSPRVAVQELMTRQPKSEV